MLSEIFHIIRLNLYIKADYFFLTSFKFFIFCIIPMKLCSILLKLSVEYQTLFPEKQTAKFYLRLSQLKRRNLANAI